MIQRVDKPVPGQESDRPSGRTNFGGLTRPFLVCALLAVVTFAVYWPVKDFDFVAYDDGAYICENPHVYAGLTWKGFVWALTTPHSGNWHTLTWLSHMLDCQLFGLLPAWHHIVNVLFHAANTVLLFALLRRMTGALWRSTLVAALFALHPLHVESVAWVSERKDVLSTFFGFLSLIFYARYAQKQSSVEPRKLSGYSRESREQTVSALDPRPSTLDYPLALLFFVFGLMSKPMLVTWPFVMLLLDWWPLNRVSSIKYQVTADTMADGVTGVSPFSFLLSPVSWRLVLEKIPFFVLSMMASALTVSTQRAWGAVAPLADFSMVDRVKHVLFSYNAYLRKTFWPDDLAIIYPLSWHWSATQTWLAALLILGLSALALGLARRQPWFLFGWLWFLGTLIPVIGFLQTGNQSMADRYAYIPLIGLFTAFTWAVNAFFQRLPKTLVATVALALLVGCAIVTRHQLRYWRDSEALYRRSIAVTKDNYLAYYNLGIYFARVRQLDDAIASIHQSILINPNVAENARDLANALSELTTPDPKLPPPVPSSSPKPDYVAVYMDLARAFFIQGNRAAAVAQYQAALRLAPQNPVAHYNLGLVFSAAGRTDDAIAQYRLALQYQPDNLEAHNNLGISLSLTGKYAEAIVQFTEALRLKPDFAEAHNNLAYALVRLGRRDEAISHLREALRIQPDYAQAREQLRQLGMPVPE